jgi:hypothetical protein
LGGLVRPGRVRRQPRRRRCLERAERGGVDPAAPAGVRLGHGVEAARGRPGHLERRELPKGSDLPPVFNPGIVALGKVLYGVDVAAASPEDAVPRIAPRPVLFVTARTTR